MSKPKQKILTLDTLARRRASWRRSKKTVVFTNGIFDIIHRGHVEYLANARRYGDILVVGVNTDASTRKLKGNARPVNRLADRLAVVTALENVDYAVSFGEQTPIKVIETLKPDVLVKGAEYRKDEIVGAPEVESWGGRVIRVRMRARQSTTAIIDRIKQLPG